MCVCVCVCEREREREREKRGEIRIEKGENRRNVKKVERFK